MSVYKNILSKTHFDAPAHWQKIKTIDMHTGGEPLRVIVDGFPAIKGNSVLECRQYVKAHYDYLRTALMFEPRGHADMYGVVLLPPFNSDSDFSVLFLHNEGYSTMCGHATLAITKLAVLQQWVEVQEGINEIKIDAPCGQLSAYAEVKNGTVERVFFHNVPSFVVALEEQVEVEGLGAIQYDLAYGGAFYAYVEVDQIPGLTLDSSSYRNLIEYGMAIKHAVIQQKTNVVHPFEEDLSLLYGTIFTGKAKEEGAHSRNVCIFAEGEVDRSPTGSGVSGRAAIHFKRGEIKRNEAIKIESILGSTMTVEVKKELKYGSWDAVVPEVSGTAHVVGQNEFVIDPNDPFAKGFILR